MLGVQDQLHPLKSPSVAPARFYTEHRGEGNGHRLALCGVALERLRSSFLRRGHLRDKIV